MCYLLRSKEQSLHAQIAKKHCTIARKIHKTQHIQDVHVNEGRGSMLCVKCEHMYAHCLRKMEELYHQAVSIMNHFRG